MARFDLSPLYRQSVGFDRFVNLVDSLTSVDGEGSGYPPYNIESTGENHYAITVAVAGFSEGELDITTEQGVLSIRGKKADDKTERNYLHQGIATRGFERKFQLADHVEVTGAALVNGLLSITLAKEVPEAMKPKRIAISGGNNLEHKAAVVEAA